MKIIFLFFALFSAQAAIAAGEVLKLNTTGTQYCSGFKPQRFNPSNDIDLWVRIDNTVQASVYTDPFLSNFIAALDVECTSISSKKAACSIYTGDVSDHIAATAILSFDSSGFIKSIRGTLIRRGVLNSCFAKAIVTGKRIN